MKIIDTPIADLKLVESVPFLDERGMFVRLFCAGELQPLLGHRKVEQINFSRTTHPGTVRGMHFQHPPHAEMKLVRCLRGRVWDVAVDLRAGSPTFLQWFATDLAQDDARMLVIPEGFAHGVQALEPNSELVYLVTAAYNSEFEDGLRPDDPRLAIDWPLKPEHLSQRDMNHPLLDSSYSGMTI